MKRLIASVVSILLCIPQFAFAEPQALRDLFRSQYEDSSQGFFRSYVRPPMGEVAISGNTIVATLHGKAVRVEIDRANRVLRYTVDGNAWIGTMNENGRLVELRDPQGTPHYPTRMNADQLSAAMKTNRAQVEYFFRTGVVPKTSPQECAEQLIVCNPFEDEGFWESIFYPMFSIALTPAENLKCLEDKNNCMDDCASIYQVAAVACIGLPTPLAAAVCELVALGGFSFCQSRCVVNYPC